MYDVKTDSAHQVSFDQVKFLSIDPGPSSVDGYTVSYESGSSGIFDLFGTGDPSGYFISKGAAKKRLQGLAQNGYWSGANFKFIGWIR
jgi:hypothetical protein